jgi:prophage regulatory protein
MRFQRLDKVMEETGKCRSSIYQEMAEGTFPKSFKIGARAIAWLDEDIQKWKRAKLQAAGRKVELAFPTPPPASTTRRPNPCRLDSSHPAKEVIKHGNSKARGMD